MAVEKGLLKNILKFIVLICLAYSVVMMTIDVIFSTLSLSEAHDNSIYFKERFCPAICGIISMIYCTFSLFKRGNYGTKD